MQQHSMFRTLEMAAAINELLLQAVLLINGRRLLKYDKVHVEDLSWFH